MDIEMRILTPELVDGHAKFLPSIMKLSGSLSWESDNKNDKLAKEKSL